MHLSDIIVISEWWVMFFLIGIIFLPLTSLLFKNFFDKGYIFSKIIGIIFISYLVFLLGVLKILPFTISTILLVAGFFTVINILILKKYWKSTIEQPASPQGGFNNRTIAIFLFEEILFLLGLTFWSYIRSFQPDIHGLEKYMDFGFVNSILRSDFFPPKDMWFTPFSINYYYFGHLITAVLTKLSNISPSITYNLMLSTIFSLTFTASFSIGANLLYKLNAKPASQRGERYTLYAIIGGILTASLVSFAGNLHTLYTFFKPYINENPLPFWQLAFSPSSFPNSYWYPNATRFIYNTIHEFPIYSFVVSDLHGHVLDIPIVLLIIAVLFSLISNIEYRNPKQSQMTKIQNLKQKKHFSHWIFENLNLFRASDFGFRILLLGFLLAVMYMTNVWDGLIYAGLTLLVFIYISHRTKNYTLYAIRYTLIIAGFFLFSLPFTLSFTPFASGIGVLCAPEFLTNVGKLGPFLFEADHCQRSPLWQLLILYGFFYFWVVSFLVFLFKKLNAKRYTLSASDVFVLILILLSTILIIIPEFFYIKDIYPAHYRANTMFKLVYQAFIMLSISSGYIIVRLFVNLKSSIINRKSYWKLAYWVIGSIGLLLVMIYPYFSINSYYGNLQIYRGLDGLSYLKNLYPTDYSAILWLNKTIAGQPVILEAQGDSYTDYARVSANTGLPTVLGWTVHEWLWRGTYDVPAPRISEVQTLYETEDFYLVKRLIDKYNISLVFIGDLERQKYPDLNEDKFQNLGKIIYQNNQTKIYQIKD